MSEQQHITPAGKFFRNCEQVLALGEPLIAGTQEHVVMIHQAESGGESVYRRFVCDTQEDAEWLRDRLNSPNPLQEPNATDTDTERVRAGLQG